MYDLYNVINNTIFKLSIFPDPAQLHVHDVALHHLLKIVADVFKQK